MNTTFENFSGGSSLLSFQTQKFAKDAGKKKARNEAEGRYVQVSQSPQPKPQNEVRYSEKRRISSFQVQPRDFGGKIGYSSQHHIHNIFERKKASNGTHGPNLPVSRGDPKHGKPLQDESSIHRNPNQHHQTKNSLPQSDSIGSQSKFTTPSNLKTSTIRQIVRHGQTKTTGQKPSNQRGLNQFHNLKTSANPNRPQNDNLIKSSTTLPQNQKIYAGGDKRYSKSQAKSYSVIQVEKEKRLRKGNQQSKTPYSSEHTGKRGLRRQYIKRTGSIDEFICFDLKVRIRKKKRSEGVSSRMYKSTFKEAGRKDSGVRSAKHVIYRGTRTESPFQRSR